jgi:tetrahydromethanopterin S-methyltransferase subunit A
VAPDFERITQAIAAATAAEKCHDCACFHDAVETLVTSELVAPLAKPLKAARLAFVARASECKGCEVCWPADALNIAARLGHLPAGVGCRMVVAERHGAWPRLPGHYRVLRHAAPVAVCTLHSRPLVDEIAATAPAGLAIVGSLQTENLGIEHLIENVVSNPHIRFVLVCGADTAAAVGHLPGQSLIALARQGLTAASRIRGARGTRPVLHNIEPTVVDHFRQQIEVVDHRGAADPAEIAAVVDDLAARDPGSVAIVPPFERRARTMLAEPSHELILDPAGYVVIYLDPDRRLMIAEHYQTTGVLDAVIEGGNAVDVMATLLHERLVTRLDHTAYLSRELTRAEQALRDGGPYVQDRAPGA